MYKQPFRNNDRDINEKSFECTYFSGTSSKAVPIPQSGCTSQLWTV